MASEDEDPHTMYNDDDLDNDNDNDDDDDLLNGDTTTDTVPLDDDVIPAGDDDDDNSSSSSDTDDTTTTAIAAVTTTASTTVTVAIPSSISATPSTSVTVALPDPKRPQQQQQQQQQQKPPIDDSRRLFQRLWTDEDEIELLQGFLEYTTGRGTTSYGHHHDTAAFYDQIKSKLQLEFNKNQLVEKLRRLKKKYRNVLSKMSSGKDFVFKSPHDQATFEISSKIWTNLGSNCHNRAGSVSVEFDDDDQQNPNPNPNPSGSFMASPNSGGGFMISHINLNNAATVGDQKPNFDMMSLGSLSGSPGIGSGGGGSVSKLSSRKRPKIGGGGGGGSGGKMEDKYVRVNLGGEGGNFNVNANNANANANISNNVSSSNNNVSNSSNVNVGPAMQGLIEETVRNCLSPMFKELINNAVNGPGLGGGVKGVGSMAMSAIPLNFSGLGSNGGGEMMDEKWRKQQILELEVYSKRLELVQDQIKSTLDELRSNGG